jgi:hypothetical protein
MTPGEVKGSRGHLKIKITQNYGMNFELINYQKLTELDQTSFFK